MDGGHRFAVLSQLASRELFYEYQTEFQRMSVGIWKYQQPMTACEILFYGCFSSPPAGLVLSDYNVLDVLKTVTTFAKRFELQYGLQFRETKLEDIRAHLHVSNFLPRTCVLTCTRHIRMAKTILLCSAALKRFLEKVPDIYRVTHLESRTFASSNDSDIVMSLALLSSTQQTQSDLRTAFFVHIILQDWFSVR